jgi:hypothetical protein
LIKQAKKKLHQVFLHLKGQDNLWGRQPKKFENLTSWPKSDTKVFLVHRNFYPTIFQFKRRVEKKLYFESSFFISHDRLLCAN